jgi:DNA-binding transcriptional LysR family regulator
MFDVLPEVIERFKQDHPQVTVSVREIDSVDAVPSLEAGDIDLAFARLDGDLGKGIEWRPLTEEQLMVALPVDHPLANHREIALASLASEPLVMFARKVSPLYFDNLIATCRANGFSPRVLHEVRSVASQIAFVSCGQGIALVPAAMNKLAPANVVIRPLAQQVSVVTTTYAWNAERANPLVQALVNQLSERIS